MLAPYDRLTKETLAGSAPQQSTVRRDISIPKTEPTGGRNSCNDFGTAWPHGEGSGIRSGSPSSSGRPTLRSSETCRIVAITGASSGLGAALARVYARPGWRLSLIARDAGRLEAVAAACREAGAGADIHIADVTDAAAMESVMTACDRRQPIDLVLANAGIGGRDALASDSGERGPIARLILTTNAIGVVNTVTPLLPALVARGRGHIAIISSLAGLTGLPASPAYSASKAAARVYGEALRRLLAPSGVRVSVVCPGFINTPFAASLPFSLPLLWSADRAALHVVRGLARGRRDIRIPWPLAVALRVAAMLPAGVADRVLMATTRVPR